MRFLQKFFGAFSFAVLSLTAMSLVHAADVKGSGYTTLSEPQPTDSGKKIEVTEFFWYGCPHCFSFDPSLTAWVKKHGDTINFRRVPVGFRDTFVPQQKAYYALEALGKIELLHSKIFDAIHKERQKLDTEAQLTEFVAKNGVDKAKFTEAFNSFSVQAKVTRATKMQTSYRIDGVPNVAIDGRYMTSPSKMGELLKSDSNEADLMAATTKVMDSLIEKVKSTAKK